MVFTMTNGVFAAEVLETSGQSDASASEVKTASASDFTDLPDDWSHDALVRAIENGLLYGSNGKINPSGNLTRAQMAAIIVRAFGAEETASLDGFSDVKPTDWYYNVMQKAVAMGIFKGDGGKLNPNGLITRQQVCAVLARAFLLEDGGNAHQKFKDADGISGYAQEAVAAMAAKGYIAGDSSGNVNATKPITRAQFAKLMDNLVKEYPSGKQGGVIEGNAVMRAGMNLSGVTIKGDLILADGLAKSNIDLSDCVVEGRIIVRGSNEVKLSGNTTAKGVVTAASTKLSNNTGSKISNVSVMGSSTTVAFAGEIGKVDIKAENVTVNAEKDAKIDSVETAAVGTTVQGSGKVEAVDVKSGASDTKVTTNNTEITVGSGAGTVTSNNGSISAGETGKTDSKGTLTAGTKTPDKGTSGSRPSGGSGGSGGGSGTTRYTVTAANGQTIGTFDSGTTLTVNLNGGGSNYTVTVSSSTTIATPTRAGYTFNGWQVSGTTLTAQWLDKAVPVVVKDSEGRTIGTYIVGVILTIDPANGTDEPYTVTVSEQTVITVPVREGYTFDRWRPANKTITAEWIKNSSDMVTVMDSNGGTVGRFENGAELTIDPANGEEVYKVTAAPDLVIEVPTREGYTFTAWDVALRKITAQWKEGSVPVQTFTLYDERGVSLGTFEAGTELTVDPANGKEPTVFTISKDTHLEIPKRDGYQFDRWRRNGLTISAEWTKLPAVMINIKDSKGNEIGRFEAGAVITVKPDNGEADYTVTIAADTIIQAPAKGGYSFVKWMRDDRVITAIWKSETPLTHTARTIYDGSQAAPILMDASYPAGREHAYTQVARAVNDLRQDIAMVNGAIDYKRIQQLFDDSPEKLVERLNGVAQTNPSKIPELVTDATLSAEYAIIVGTYKDSKLIQDLVAAGKLSGAEVLTKTDAWESYTIQEVDNPTANIKKALVIAGADPRGTIFGIYTISEEIGVSPWYWYSDVPVKTKSVIDVDYTTALKVGNPDVKYRGIFINDEEYSNYWARGKFTSLEPELNGNENKQPGVNYYRRLFEVILRMKGNALWPAMHVRSTPFFGNKNENGDSINGIEAGKYGIVMGSSHCEILLRNSNTEWDPWIKEYNSRSDVSNTNTSYNFCTNKTAMLQYWRERLQEAKRNGVEGVMVLGLRGKHDGEAAYTNGYYANRTEMMKAVIKEQRALIKEVYGSETAVAQVYVAYDDLGERYNDGVNQLLADPAYNDIIVMWANDSYGNLRQTPNAEEQKRPGGSGIYYHNSYMGWGGERKSYLFLNSLPIQQMNEQMHRAYDCGMKTYWILNVGDLKPGDVLAQYFIEMGWDMEKTGEGVYAGHPAEGIHSFLADWCVKQYAMSQADAEAVASAMEEFYDLTNIKKVEFYGVQNSDPPFSGSMAYPCSVTSMGDEGQRIVDRANAMVDAMTAACNKMDTDTQNAFFEQMYFLAQAYRDIAEEYVYYWKNLEYAKQGRVGSAQLYKELSQQALNRMLEKVEEYGTLNNGKWDRFISPVHKYTGDWGQGQNQGIVMLDESRYQTAAESEGLGVYAEGGGTLRFNSLSDDTRYIDVFAKGAIAEEWSMEAPAWIKLSSVSGIVATEERILVTIDWSQVSGTQNGGITIKNSDGTEVASVPVKAVNKSDFNYGDTKGYVEANGYVMIEAEYFSANEKGSDNSEWYKVYDRGPRGTSMKVSDGFPELGENTGSGAKLTYNVYFEEAGTYPLTYYRIFTLNEGSINGVTNACRTMISVNGKNVGLLRGTATFRSGNWFKSIHTSNEPLTTNITVNQGWNTIEVIRSSPSIVFDNILIVTDSTAVPNSLLGPEVSPNNIMTDQEYAAYRQGVAGLPAGITEGVEKQIRLDDIAPMNISETAGETEATVNARILYGERGDKIALAVQSNKDAVATAAVRDGKVFITPKAIGTATITLTASVENNASIPSVTKSFTVNVLDALELAKAYRPNEQGNIIINAADAAQNKPYAAIQEGSANSETYRWIEVNESDHKSMQVQKSGDQPTSLKDGVTTGTPWNDTNTWTSAPQMTYKVYVPTAGKYYLSVYSYSWDDQSNSFHLILNGQHQFRAGKDTGKFTNEKDQWGSIKGDEWFYGNVQLDLKAGENTITIAGRKSGFVLRQIMLSPEKKTDMTSWLTACEASEPSSAIANAPLEEIPVKAPSPAEIPTPEPPAENEVPGQNEAPAPETPEGTETTGRNDTSTPESPAENGNSEKEDPPKPEAPKEDESSEKVDTPESEFPKENETSEWNDTPAPSDTPALENSNLEPATIKGGETEE